MNAPLTTDERLPKEHGSAGQTHELVDLGGPVARIARYTYVGSEWTRLLVMVPPDHAHNVPAQNLDIVLDAKQVALLSGRLAWPK